MFSDEQLAQVLWDFNVQLNAPQKADVILVLGSHDIRVAHKAAELFHQGYAPLLVFSGNVGRLTEGVWNKPEAEVFAEEARKLGVPATNILTETGSTNTGENIELSLALLANHGIHPNSFLIVQKPYMLQRALATFKKKLPEVPVSLACSDVSFAEYPNEVIDQQQVINIMVGDLQRLKLYPAKGFQALVNIPDHVWVSYEELVQRGYTAHLIEE